MKIYYWHNPSNNRYYLVTRERDLFDDIVITHFADGSKFKNGRKLKTMPLSSRKDLADHIRKLKKIRKKHGYDKSRIIDHSRIFHQFY